MDVRPERGPRFRQIGVFPPWIWIIQLAESSSLTCKIDVVPLLLAFQKEVL